MIERNYEGERDENNLKSGMGRIEYENGWVYEGELKNDKKNGKGQIFNENHVL